MSTQASPRGLDAFECSGCGRLAWPRPVQCHRCGAGEFTARVVPGRGQLVSYTVVRRPGGAFAGQPPFAVAMIDLDAGLRVTRRLAAFEPEPELGAPVELVTLADGTEVFTTTPHPAGTA